MRKVFAMATAMFLAVALSGCESVRDIVALYGGDKGLELLDKASAGADKIEGATLGNAVKSVDLYCNKVPPAARKIFRDRINGRPEIQGNQLGIWCKGDPPLEMGPVPEVTATPLAPAK